MNLNAPVSTIMSKNYHVVASDVSIGKAEKIMRKKRVKLLAVEENNELLGIVSDNDCQYFRDSLERDGIHGPDEILRLKHHKVHEIMNTRLVRLIANDSIRKASEIMKSIIFQVIPVVDQKKLIGVLTPQVIRKCQDSENSLMRSR